MNKALLVLTAVAALGLSACNTNTETSVVNAPSMDHSPQPTAVEEVVEVVEDTEGESVFLAYNAADYDAAVAEGKDVFLDFHADWCPTCRANAPKIEAAFEENGNSNLIGFQVNYDKEVDLKKEFNIFSQSQLVLIPGGEKGEAVTYAPGIYSKEKVLEILNS